MSKVNLFGVEADLDTIFNDFVSGYGKFSDREICVYQLLIGCWRGDVRELDNHLGILSAISTYEGLGYHRSIGDHIRCTAGNMAVLAIESDPLYYLDHGSVFFREYARGMI